EEIVDAGRRVELHRHRAHRKRHALTDQFRVVHADGPQELGARPLEEMQICRVIDDARAIGVLVIDANVEAMGFSHPAARSLPCAVSAARRIEAAFGPTPWTASSCASLMADT